MSILLYQTYITSADYSALEGLLSRADFPAERLAMLKTRRTPLSRAQSLAATVLLEQAVTDWVTKEYQKLPPVRNDPFEGEEVVLRSLPVGSLTRLPPAWPVGAKGQPFPNGIETAAGQVYVSLSHSDGIVMVAVADRPVGVDTQCLSVLPSTRWWQLDARIRHSKEEPAPNASSFAHRWAAKEAALKATGEGLSRSMCTLRVEEERVCSDFGDRFQLWQGVYESAAVFTAVAVVRATSEP